MPEPTPEPLEPAQSTPEANSALLVNKKGMEDILSEIDNKLKAQEFQGALPLSVRIGSSVVFKAILGQEPTINKITPAQFALLQQAIADPQGILGSVRIYVGKENVFHVTDGVVKEDKLGLAPTKQFTQENTQAIAQVNQSQTQSASLQDQITALQTTVERQQQQIDALNQRLNQIVDSSVFVANEKLSNWFSNVRSKVQTAGQSAVAQVSDKLEQNKAALVSKAQEFLTSVKESVTDTLHAALNNVQAQAGEMTLGAMNAATAKLASVIGEKLPDGSFVIESRDRNQRLEVSGNNVALQSRPQLDAQALWNNYSQGIPQDRPIQRTLAVAQNAMRDGMTRTAVEDMLYADPQFQKVQQDQGLNKAQEYARQMTRSASRREQQALEPQQQQRSFRQSRSNSLQQ